MGEEGVKKDPVFVFPSVALVGFEQEQESGAGKLKQDSVCYFDFLQVSEDHDWDGERVVMTDRYFVISLD